ncbi:primosomal protein DnaI [Lactobacillus sp. S2-2]|uniref:primosomal protein DnaI n=1 Tax=Lactobacillus sp. S2-2 TaxID=2692917 RepID=UPI001F407246|nr:primosomal protein DnaI [Lactobacillus sp. S2-2]MCF6515149.1 primosomal protein DnaI [Lactobacillus sp. S2-2]
MKDLGFEMESSLKKNNALKKYHDLMNQVYEDKDVKDFLNQNQDKLSKDAIIKSSAKLYEFFNEKNKINKGQSNFANGYIPQLVMNNSLIDVSYVASPELIKQRENEKNNKLIQTISMPKDAINADILNYDKDNGRIEALSEALDFIENYKTNSNNFHKGLYLYGPFGTGKTYLLGAIANELANSGVQSLLLHFPSFIVELKNSIGNSNISNKLDRIKKSEILMIDDIGADSMSSWVRDDILGTILEYRMQNELSTFFSSNFSMQQFEDEHLKVNQRGDIEPLKAKRLMERIYFLADEIEVTGRNRRRS